jgi:hypothetical protein
MADQKNEKKTQAQTGSQGDKQGQKKGEQHGQDKGQQGKGQMGQQSQPKNEQPRQQGAADRAEGQPDPSTSRVEEQGRMGVSEIRRKDQNPNEYVGDDMENEPQMGVGRPTPTGPKQIR